TTSSSSDWVEEGLVRPSTMVLRMNSNDCTAPPSVKAGWPCSSNSLPPNEAVIRAQSQMTASACAQDQTSGYCTPALSLIFLAASATPSQVPTSAGSTPALARMSLLW